MASYTKKAIKNKDCGYYYLSSGDDFIKITGFPIAYWVTDTVRNIFLESDSLNTIGSPTHGVVTGDNDTFLKNWHEVSLSNIKFDAHNRKVAQASNITWFPVTKGGAFRKWCGNFDYVINWHDDGYLLRTTKHESGRIRATNFNLNRIFQPGITWSTISSSSLSMRYLPPCMIFESKGSVCFTESEKDRFYLLALTNTKVINKLLLIMSPTLDYHEGPMGKLPIVKLNDSRIFEISIMLKNISKQDWDSYETSWDFSSWPLLQSEYKKSSLEESYKTLRAFWQTQVDTMKKLEEENNDIFIKAYGLEDELKPEVPLKEITLTCNPAYRYDAKKSIDELEALLLADTVKEYISYAVGVMFGRYSLDHDGLHIANQNKSFE